MMRHFNVTCRTSVVVACWAVALAAHASSITNDDQDAEQPDVANKATTAPDDEPTVEVARLQRVVIVVGAPGQDIYEPMFHQWARRWQEAAERAAAKVVVVGLDESNEKTDRDRLQSLLTEQPERDDELLWLVLLGHGTFDGHAAKFNLRGPDLSADQLSQWLADVATPTVVINCASASAPFINALAGENRVVVAATKSGYEMNFARFGQYLSSAIADPAADLDKDDQVSLLEAFLTASRQVEEFYAQETRLATEHALIDDNGDGLGTPADWFRGVRAVQQAKQGASLDGLRAHQLHLLPSDRERRLPREVRQRRDELERDIEALRQRKSSLDADAYYAELEPLMLELARLYNSAEPPKPESANSQ